MRARYPNLAKLELVADALGVLREQLVFVGGCAVDLLLTDPAAAPTRITFDVDLVARVEALSGYTRWKRSLPGSVSSGIWRRMRPFAAGVTTTSKWI